MKFFDQIEPTCIVKGDGAILFFNSSFELFLNKHFEMKVIPASIFKIMNNDQSAKDKLLQGFQKVF